MSNDNPYSTMIQEINVSSDLSRSGVNELGRKQPYSRMIDFPVEVDVEFTKEKYISSVNFELTDTSYIHTTKYNPGKMWRNEMLKPVNQTPIHTMTPLNFCYWLQGYIEIAGEPPSPAQFEVIKEHLALVFKKETVLQLQTYPEDDGIIVMGDGPFASC